MRLPTCVLASAAALLLLSASGSASADCQHAVRWTSDALLPLALVRGPRVEAAKGQCGKLDHWVDHTRWRTLDRWGRVVGEVEYREDSTRGERFELISGTRGSGVFVRGPWRAPSSAAFEPAPAVRASFERWLGKPRERREIQFFRAAKPGAPEAFAVVITPRSILVAHAEGAKWRPAFREVYEEKGWHPLYRLRAILDMNGDGLPEVIYHFNEYDDGRGYEVVLSPKRGGKVYEQTAHNRDDGP